MVSPNRGWRVLRRLSQTLAFVAIVLAPLLGGWQRLDRAEMAAWSSEGRELPSRVRHDLPLGAMPARAHASNVLLGGGLAAEYVDVPAVDPVAGAVSLLGTKGSLRALLALAIPVLLALVGGRVFCGWLCPFGTVARTLDALLDRVPLRPGGFTVPEVRPVRYALLAGTLLASLFGVHLAVYLFLPHLLVQQSVYAAWLLGGGSVVLAVLLGLLVAAVLFGPRTYCAAVCPTGGALALLGRRRALRLRIAAPARCGKTCDLCTRACWLDLDPRSGDPGPDCDLCARCVPICPKTNLRVGLGQGALKGPPGGAKVALSLLALSALFVGPDVARARGETKPALVLHGELVVDGVTVAVDAVDMTGVRLDADSTHEEHGLEVSAFVARGAFGAPDRFGQIPGRDVYTGPLTLRLIRADGRLRMEFDEPTSPRSSPRRHIYRRRVDVRLAPGDVVEVAPVDGWLEEPVRFTVPSPGAARSLPLGFGFFAAAALAFMGLLSLALAVPPRRGARPQGAESPRA